MDNNQHIQFREELKMRLRQFVLHLIKLCQQLPANMEANILKKQLLRSGSSVYANYRAANRQGQKQNSLVKSVLLLKKLMKLKCGLIYLLNQT